MNSKITGKTNVPTGEARSHGRARHYHQLERRHEEMAQEVRKSRFFRKTIEKQGGKRHFQI